jgi:photosystem II stability/assembly factor-like uncharacterized protein
MRLTLRYGVAAIFLWSAAVPPAAPLADAENARPNPSGCAVTLAQAQAAAKQLDERFRALSEDQKAKLEKDMASLRDKISRTEQETYLHAIQFLGPKVGVGLDWRGLLHRTSDCGLTWTETRLPLGVGVIGWLSKWLNVPAPERAPFRNMHFADSRFGLIVGGTGILRSEDGGVTWRAVRAPTDRQTGAVWCTAKHTCWVSSDEARAIFRSSNLQSGGWSRQTTPAEGIISAVQFVTESAGWAVTHRGEIIGTTDAGEHWNALFHDGTRDFYSLHFVDEQGGWVVGADAVVMRTQDGGSTWVDQELPLLPDVPAKEVRLHAVKFLDGERGWAAGMHGMTFATTDGGEFWAVQRFEGLPSNWLTVYSLAITEGPVIWASGNSGNIFVSIDEGEFWFPVHGVAAQVFDAMQRLIDHPSE